MKKETKEKIISVLGAAIIRFIGRTMRIRMKDEADFFSRKHTAPYILAFWHNRMIAVPELFRRFYGDRKGVSVLISQSKDGKMISDIILRLGIDVVNGSSSRGGAAAAYELTKCIRGGKDVAITPDGPRGPRYELNGGLVFLAHRTGAPIMPIHVEYSHCIRFNSWDKFMLPLPFTRVDITLGELQKVPRLETETEFEKERQRLEKIMQPKTE